jgi:hypothetical protein
MDVIPFQFDAYGGWGKVQGLARLDEHGLELQFSTSDAMFGVLKTGQRSLRVPLEDLLSVRFGAGWFWLFPYIELRVRDLATLKDLPESDQGRVRLSLSLGDRHDGRAFAADLELMRSRRRILQLDRAIDRLSAAAPPTTSPGTSSDAAASRPAGPRSAGWQRE